MGNEIKKKDSRETKGKKTDHCDTFMTIVRDDGKQEFVPQDVVINTWEVAR